VEVIELAGVDLATTQRLLAELIEGKTPRRMLQRVHEVSGGNPLYVLALGAELARQGGHAGGSRGLPIPTTLGDAIAQLLKSAGAGIEAPLFAVAALAHATPALLAAALDNFDVSDLDEAVGAGVVEIAGDRIRFSHPLLASVHYASVPAHEQRDLHLRLAGAVANREERSMHLALGTETPDEEIAGELEAAAALAAQRGAPEAAAELLEQAIRLTPLEQYQARWSRTATAAEHYYAAGDSAQARKLLEQVLLEQPDGQTSARARLRLALVRTDDFEFGVSMLQQALLEAGDDDRLRTEILLVQCDWCGNVGDAAGQLQHARAAVSSAERLGAPGPLAAALAALGAGLFHRGEGIRHDLFKRAIDLERSAPQSTSTYYLPSTMYGSVLRIENDLDAARPLLEQAVRRARQRGEEGADLIPLLVRLARLESEAGNVAASGQWLAAATEAARTHVNYEMDSWLAHLRAEIAVGRGDLERARSDATEVLRLATQSGDVQMQRDGDAVLAEVELLSGETQSAHQRIQPWRERTIAHGPWYVGWMTLSLWSIDVEALILSHRLDEAQPVLEDLLARASIYPNPHAAAIAARCEGLLLAARGRLADAIEAMEAALAAHARRPVPLEVGRTLLEKGSIERRAKRKAAAKQTLEQALAILEPLDSAIWLARTRDELGRIGLRRATVSDGLTPAQQRVAELAASGATNREIALKLYMSERTVEAHLTKVYREFGIRSRAQLAVSIANADHGVRLPGIG
jgi:DNA-binding NarL/FixJ family response regulator